MKLKQLVGGVTIAVPLSAAALGVGVGAANAAPPPPPPAPAAPAHHPQALPLRTRRAGPGGFPAERAR